MELCSTSMKRVVSRGCLIVCGWLMMMGPVPVASGQCLKAHLFASDAAVGDEYGNSSAISGDTLVVGAWVDDTSAGIDAGSVYVYIRNGTSWALQQHLFASDGAASDYYGYTVAITGDTLVVGAVGDNTSGGVNAGSAYVYVRNNGVWTQQARLFASDGAAVDEFGAVGISGDTIIVGALSDDTPAGLDAGSAYIFVRIGNAWTQEEHLLAPNAAAGDLFGNWVALDGDTAVVGAQLDDNQNGTDAGSAYVFVRSGTIWMMQQQLFASDGANGDNFGFGVEVSGDTIAVSAILDDTPGGIDAGSAYVFVRDGEDNWTEQGHLVASDTAFDDRFATDIALSGDMAVVGSNRDDTPKGVDAGSAYLFTRTAGIWTEQRMIHAPDGAAEDHFGVCVEISGTSVVVGAYGDDTPGGANAGSAYVLDLSCTPGDLNCDNAISLADVPHFIEALLATGFTGCDVDRADMNFDGQINGRDMQPFVHAVLEF